MEFADIVFIACINTPIEARKVFIKMSIGLEMSIYKLLLDLNIAKETNHIFRQFEPVLSPGGGA